MRYFYIDSCALVKRYHKEKGPEQVDILFDTLIGRKPKCLITSIISIPETVATLNRKKNEGKIGTIQFKEILANLFDEVDMLDTITVDEERILGSIPLITKHNLNSVDTLHLSAIKEAGEIAKDIEGTVIMVTSDKRLLMVSENEGFKTLNPEEVDVITIKGLIEV